MNRAEKRKCAKQHGKAYANKKYREEANLTEQDLAEKIGAATEYIRGWEQNKKTPRIRSLWKIADIYNVSIDELIGRTQKIKYKE